MEWGENAAVWHENQHSVTWPLHTHTHRQAHAHRSIANCLDPPSKKHTDVHTVHTYMKSLMTRRSLWRQDTYTCSFVCLLYKTESLFHGLYKHTWCCWLISKYQWSRTCEQWLSYSAGFCRTSFPMWQWAACGLICFFKFIGRRSGCEVYFYASVPATAAARGHFCYIFTFLGALYNAISQWLLEGTFWKSGTTLTQGSADSISELCVPLCENPLANYG